MSPRMRAAAATSVRLTRLATARAVAFPVEPRALPSSFEAAAASGQARAPTIALRLLPAPQMRFNMASLLSLRPIVGRDRETPRFDVLKPMIRFQQHAEWH